MINTTQKFGTKEIESALQDVAYNANNPMRYTREKTLDQWGLVGVYYPGKDYCCPCKGGCDARARLYNHKGKLFYDCPACALIEIPHLNPIPIEELYWLLVDNPMDCISSEALRFCVNTSLITIEDYTYYALIPFSDHYDLNEKETTIVQTVNTAFTTHIEECDSKYQQQRHSW